MSITLTKAMEVFKEGERAHQDCIVLCPYEKNTSEHFWWAEGWLDKYKSGWKRIKNARNKK